LDPVFVAAVPWRSLGLMISIFLEDLSWILTEFDFD
jgi:hypothetical protein